MERRRGPGSRLLPGTDTVRVRWDTRGLRGGALGALPVTFPAIGLNKTGQGRVRRCCGGERRIDPVVLASRIKEQAPAP